MTSLLRSTVPAQARREVFYPFYEGFKRMVSVSAPNHLTTIATCLINYFAGNDLSLWWLACVMFVFGHAYPLKTGLRILGLTGREWDSKTLPETRAFIQEFVDINARRLLLVDFPGWLCVLATVVMSLRSH
jgi:hypothetical protein